MRIKNRSWQPPLCIATNALSGTTVNVVWQAGMCDTQLLRHIAARLDIPQFCISLLDVNKCESAHDAPPTCTFVVFANGQALEDLLENIRLGANMCVICGDVWDSEVRFIYGPDRGERTCDVCEPSTLCCSCRVIVSEQQVLCLQCIDDSKVPPQKWKRFSCLCAAWEMEDE